MKRLPHPSQSQCHLRSLVCIRSCRIRSDRRVKPSVLAQPGCEQKKVARDDDERDGPALTIRGRLVEPEVGLEDGAGGEGRGRRVGEAEEDAVAPVGGASVSGLCLGGAGGPRLELASDLAPETGRAAAAGFCDGGAIAAPKG